MITENAAPVPSARRWSAVGPLLVLAAFLLATSLYTGQVWEDFLITFRHSRNWVEGAGLVYQPGERVQGFTSPLNVLIPAFAYRLCPGFDFVLPLWVFRLVGLVVLVGGMGVLWRRGGDGAWRWLAVLLIGLQVKTVVFAMNGQEAAYMLGFLALALAAAARGYGADWRLAGCAWAGLMWTRPDSPVYIVALVFGGLAFGSQAAREQWRGIARAAVLAAVLYAPWFAWAWYYYGNPVPQTVLAKFGAGHEFLRPSELPVVYAVAWFRAAGGIFAPVYERTAHWPGWSLAAPVALGSICVLPWMWRRMDPITRLCSWMAFCSVFYLAFLDTVGTAYPWYYPPAGLCGAIALGRLAQAVWTAARRDSARQCALAGGMVIVAALGWVAVFGFEQQRVRQQLVEEGVRKQVGCWLAAHVRPEERVFLEPIGYIGYYSRAHVLDYPGLVSPAVVAVRRAGAPTFLGIIHRLRPAWVVLRDAEYVVANRDPMFSEGYEAVQRFRADPSILRYRNFPGYGYIFADSSFVVCRRRTAR